MKFIAGGRGHGGWGWEEGEASVCHKVLIVSMRTDVKCAQLAR